MSTLDKIRQRVANTLKKAVAEKEAELLEMRKRELSKRENDDCLICNRSAGKCECGPDRPCNTCEKNPCVCVGRNSVKPTKPVESDNEGSGSGTEARKNGIKKAEIPSVPTAKPPAPPKTATPKMAPTVSKAMGPPAPATGAAPAAPHSGPMAMGKSIPGREIAKSISENLKKALPRLGGKDPMSQGMTQGAANAAKPVATATAKVPALSQQDQARRQAELADFTPAGAFSPAGKGTAVAGEMKPMATPNIQRFRDAGKMQKAEMSTGSTVPNAAAVSGGESAPLAMSEDMCKSCGQGCALCKCGK